MRKTTAACHVSVVLLLSVVVAAIYAAPARGQSETDEILRCLEEAVETMKAGCQNTPAPDWTEVIEVPDKHPETYTEMVAGLEAFAASHGSRRVRSFALTILMFAGRNESPRSTEATGALTRIFDAIEDDYYRTIIVYAMRAQVDRQVALTFLEHAAQALPLGDSDRHPAPTSLIVLSEMEAEGRAVLQSLHASGAVRDPLARLRLDRLAEAGFREPY